MRRTKGTADPIDMYVGSRMRLRRLGIGVSQSKLGEAIGVTFQQVQKYEKGANRIGAGNLFKIARFLGVDVGYFFESIPEEIVDLATPSSDGLEDARQAPLRPDHMISREAVMLLNNYFAIADEKLRRRIFLFMQALAKTRNEKESRSN